MKDYEQDDPFELTGTRYPVTDPIDADRHTALCVIEEYALMGSSAAEILALFRSPMYGHTNAIYLRRGEPFVSELVGQVFGSHP